MNARGAVSGLVLAFTAASCGGENGETGGESGLADACLAIDATAEECDLWLATVLPSELPKPRGNRFGDDPAAAKLGFDLFFDPAALSEPGQNISCARCHAPEQGFSDQVPLSLGLGRTKRNALPLVNAARNFPHFWDGRADSLWSQPLFTIENEVEMKGTRLGVAHFVAENYRKEYEAAFGRLPDLSDEERFPAQGKPGDAAWEAMAEADRDTVNGVYVNVGKALEAYERKLAAGPSDVDRFLSGKGELSPGARRGMKVFAEAGCFGCHAGSHYTDGAYHALDIPVPPYLAGDGKDHGRAEGIAFYLQSEFNSMSQFYDREPGEVPRLEQDTGTSARDEGAFLTPSLRDVGITGPFGHNGVFTTVEEAVRFHLTGGGPSRDDERLSRRDLSDEDVSALLELLDALHGDTAPLPWSFWPSNPK